VRGWAGAGLAAACGGGVPLAAAAVQMDGCLPVPASLSTLFLLLLLLLIPDHVSATPTLPCSALQDVPGAG
jgi:hypothetical protein